jgi:excinuclease ABC subunit C
MQLEILGNFKESMKDFKRVMIELAQDMHFEEAQKNQRENRSFRKLSIAINHCKSKSPILMFSQLFLMKVPHVNFLQIAHGSIIRSHTMEIKKKLEETDEELELAIELETLSIVVKRNHRSFSCRFGTYKSNRTTTAIKQILDLSIQTQSFTVSNNSSSYKLWIQTGMPIELWHKCKRPQIACRAKAY